MNKYLAAAAISAALVLPAHAGVMSSKELFDACSVPVPKVPADLGKNATVKQLMDNMSAKIDYLRLSQDSRSCRFYILGVAEGIAVFADLYSVKDCVPDGVMMSDLAEIYVRYYKNHPEVRHLDAKETVTASFIEAFSCRKETRL